MLDSPEEDGFLVVAKFVDDSEDLRDSSPGAENLGVKSESCSSAGGVVVKMFSAEGAEVCQDEATDVGVSTFVSV